ncbi:hypothetical protein WHY34_04520 [Clostridium perfringens]
MRVKISKMRMLEVHKNDFITKEYLDKNISVLEEKGFNNSNIYYK